MGHKFRLQANNFSANLHELNNQAMRRALMRGYRMLIDATKMDSGQAAYHWQIVTGDTRRTLGPITYTPMKGKDPVGVRGDRGKNRDSITSQKVAQTESFIKRRVSGKTPDTLFAFYNPILESNLKRYAENAELKKALREAADIVIEYYMRLMKRFITSGGTTWGVRKGVLNDYTN